MEISYNQQILKIDADVNKTRTWPTMGQMGTISAQIGKDEVWIPCRVLVLGQMEHRALGLYQHIYSVCSYRQNNVWIAPIFNFLSSKSLWKFLLQDLALYWL